MATLIKNVRIIDPFASVDVVDDALITPQNISIAPVKIPTATTVIDGTGMVLAPGLVDLHVHFREPGFTHKETIREGIARALAGGFTSAVVMPNTKPAIDSYKAVSFQHKRAEKSGFDLMVAAAATFGLGGEVPTDVALLKKAGAVGITDDGRPVMSERLMQAQLRACRRENVVFMQHAEDLCQSHNHPMHEGTVSQKLAINGQPASAEADMVARDIALAERIGARYHVLHLSCSATLKHVRAAKRRGVAVTAEVTPHHLLLSDRHVLGLDTCFKMNPPLRTDEDRRALLAGLNDHTIDAVASDHAPHTRAEKARGFVGAPFGVTGLETTLSCLLTLVHEGKITLKRAIELLTTGPAAIVNRHGVIGTMLGDQALKNAVLFDPKPRFQLSRRHLRGRSHNSPFLGAEFYGRVVMTFLNGCLLAVK
jgi:dihydroorotase